MCKRGHSKWHLASFIQLDGSVKKKCDYILGHKMNEGKGNRTVMCGDLPIGESLPSGYMALTELAI